MSNNGPRNSAKYREAVTIASQTVKFFGFHIHTYYDYHHQISLEII